MGGLPLNTRVTSYLKIFIRAHKSGKFSPRGCSQLPEIQNTNEGNLFENKRTTFVARVTKGSRSRHLQNTSPHLKFSKMASLVAGMVSWSAETSFRRVTLSGKSKSKGTSRYCSSLSRARSSQLTVRYALPKIGE